jgi:hypothetical protein
VLPQRTGGVLNECDTRRSRGPLVHVVKAIRLVIESTAGMYGDLQGIAGRSLGEIEGLDVQLLEAPKAADDGA